MTTVKPLCVHGMVGGIKGRWKSILHVFQTRPWQLGGMTAMSSVVRMSVNVRAMAVELYNISCVERVAAAEPIEDARVTQ